MKNIRIVPWVSRRAAEFVGRLPEYQMSTGDDYGRAYREWKRISPVTVSTLTAA
jgi:hypothetical protein